MTTLTIQIPDKEQDLFLEVLKKFNGKVIANKTPNHLTQKTLDDAHQGKGLDQPIENVKKFVDSL